MKQLIYLVAALTFTACSVEKQEPIDRYKLVTRNNPSVTAVDSLASLSVGNGEFAFTTDITGLQTFPEVYKSGVPLGTQSQWGWHSFANPDGYKPEDAWKEYDLVADIRKYTHVSSRKKDGSVTLQTGFVPILTVCIWELSDWN